MIIYTAGDKVNQEVGHLFTITDDKGNSVTLSTFAIKALVDAAIAAKEMDGRVIVI